MFKSLALHVGGIYFQSHYCGNFIYEGGSLSKVLTPEGYLAPVTYRYKPTPTSPLVVKTEMMHNYFLRDHLGNTRVQLKQNKTSLGAIYFSVSDIKDYYAFGLEHGRPWEQVLGGYTSTNPYLYNGKEMDRMHGLNQLDYGARWYDPSLGRWGGVDPLAEKYYGISTYVYCLDNPVRFIDPDGRVVWVPLIIAGKAAIGAGIDLTAQMTINMTVGGQGFGEALKSVDWTSVGSSAVAGALTAPGMSTAAKLLTAGAAILDASTDVTVNNGVKSVVASNKSLAAATSDLAFSTLGGEASNAIVGSMKSAISADLTSGAFKSLTKVEQSVMRQTSNVVNSTATQSTIGTITQTIAGAANETVKNSSGGSNSQTTTTPIQPPKAKEPWILF